ncbi:MAG: hypothetical protein A3H42_03705 [Deltaproteobacteria bacterium RIFCSPLOWO2_02_FULL_46_8]|nr:MAG: hypothetical protein A3H42_03705 [Deltaproteobacteria bacterium RIFCSPLOWO2_02_FULL_46_8]
MKRTFKILLCCSGLFLGLLPMEGWAGPNVFGFKSSGDLTAGGRVFPPGRLPQTERAEFEEYRDLPQQFFLEKFQFNLENEDGTSMLELRGTKVPEQDQNFSLTSSKIGTYRFEFEWDQTPHIFSTDGRMLGTTTSPGVYTLPTPRPPANSYDAAPLIDKISVRWDTARFLLSYAPDTNWDLKGEYRWINKEGNRPMGMSFGSAGNNFREILEPVTQDVHDLRFSAGYGDEKYQLQFLYNLSIFLNDLSSATSDNPDVATNGAFVASATGGSSAPATGRTSLPPDNVAHTWMMAGGVSNLPLRTRVNGTISYSLRLQNRDFLAQTINPNIPTTNLALPRSSLGGDVGVLTANLDAISRLANNFTLTTKYRYFGFNDNTDDTTFAARVVSDRTLTNGNHTADRFSFDRQQAGVDARWQIIKPVALTVGMGWDRWDRGPHREADTTDEYMPKLSMDVTPFDWLLFRGTYAPSVKSVGFYNATLVPAQENLLRKFDEASRRRHKLDFFAQLTPRDNFSAGFNYSLRRDKYEDSVIGLQASNSWAAGTDLSWSPFDTLTFFGGYTREQYASRQFSRYRESTMLENATYNWSATTYDTIDTARFGFDAILIAKKLNWGTSWDYSHEFNQMRAFNPQTPTGGTAAQNASATAGNLPIIKSTLSHLETNLRYYFAKGWTSKIAYVMEDFSKTDFRTNGLVPATGADIFLGNDLRNYTAHMVTMTLGYQFN